MKHETNNNKVIQELKFVPFEDFLGLSLDGGIFFIFNFKGLRV